MSRYNGNIKPISPDEVVYDIPEFVIEAVNKLIAKNFRGNSFTIKQKDIVKEICDNNTDVTSQQIYDNKWMNFEDIYREAGWKVSYDKPGFNESYDATFEFKPKK